MTQCVHYNPQIESTPQLGVGLGPVRELDPRCHILDRDEDAREVLADALRRTRMARSITPSVCPFAEQGMEDWTSCPFFQASPAR